MFDKQTIKDIDLSNKTVLVRVDYNVPLDKDGQISDDLRIQASLPTLRFLLDKNCKIILISHLGRPEGKPSSKYSLKNVAIRLGKLIGRDVKFIDECIGKKVQHKLETLNLGEIALLENLRFHPGEEANDYQFAANLAKTTNARYFVQDGFGVVHRAHASTSAITHFIPAVSGFLLENEIDMLTKVSHSKDHPVVAVLGGAKVSDKIAVIKSLIGIADKIIIGGAMANTFLSYRGVNLGASKIESGQAETLDEIYKLAIKKVGLQNIDNYIILPHDLAVAKDSRAVRRRTVPIYAVAHDEMAFDIGDQTVDVFCRAIKCAKTVIWNGTMGLAENQTFGFGSSAVAKCIASLSGALTVIGGGDTADFAIKWCKNNNGEFSHISTGGGASLDLIAGQTLPGVEALLVSKK